MNRLYLLAQALLGCFNCWSVIFSKRQEERKGRKAAPRTQQDLTQSIFQQTLRFLCIRLHWAARRCVPWKWKELEVTSFHMALAMVELPWVEIGGFSAGMAQLSQGRGKTLSSLLLCGRAGNVRLHESSLCPSKYKRWWETLPLYLIALLFLPLQVEDTLFLFFFFKLFQIDGWKALCNYWSAAFTVQPIKWTEKRYSLGKILCCKWGFGSLTFTVEAKIKKDGSVVYSHSKTRPVLRMRRNVLH